jgi:hypothetical protein
VRFVISKLPCPASWWTASLIEKAAGLLSLSAQSPLTFKNRVSYIQMSHELRSLLRESVPYDKIYRYNPKPLCPKLNVYGDNGQRKVWSSGGSTHCTLSADSVPQVYPHLPCQITEIPLTLLRQYSTMAGYACHV